jgi:tetratricopeptide (TPR) repeat protein
MKNLGLIFILILSILIPAKKSLSKEDLQTIETYILRENYTQAISAAKKVLPLLPAYDVPRAQFLLGLAYLKSGQPQTARKYFQLALRGSQDNNLIKRANLAIGDSYFVENNFERAASCYIQFLDKYKRTDYEQIVKFKLAQSYLKLGKWSKAKRLLESVAKSSSVEAEPAKKILKEGQFFFTIQVGSFQNKKNAYNLLRKLKKEGLKSFVIETQIDNLTFYRVRVGGLNARKEAERLAKKLKEKGLPAKIYP